jgi:hypothetical protein
MEAFEKLADNLADHHTMAKQDAYFRVYLARRLENMAVAARPEPGLPRVEKSAAKVVESGTEERPTTAGPSKIFSGFFGKQLGAVKKDGRPYVCGFEKTCTFLHMSIAGKTSEALVEMTAPLPANMKRDFLRAIQAREK